MNQQGSVLPNNAYEDELAELIREELEQAPPPNTRGAYKRAMDSFIDFCARTQVSALPASEVTLAAYVSSMRQRKYAPATITQHVGAVRALHKKNGWAGQPGTYQASLLLRKYRRDRAEAGVGQKQALPVSPDALRKMIATLDLATMTGQRDRLALVLGFCGMLRRSEIVGLRVHDATVTGDGLALLVRTSKTDKDSRGRHVPIPPQNDPDPVSLTQEWLRLIDDGFLLRRVSRSDELLDVPWRAAGVCDMVKRCARDAGLPNAERYTAHSLRAGGLTASLRAGVSLGVAARHGGWSPESAVPARYARVADQWRDNAMKGIL